MNNQQKRAGQSTREMAAKVTVRQEIHSISLHFRDASQSALIPSILDKAFKGEL